LQHQLILYARSGAVHKAKASEFSGCGHRDDIDIGIDTDTDLDTDLDTDGCGQTRCARQKGVGPAGLFNSSV
jgi:hypothetical protein